MFTIPNCIEPFQMDRGTPLTSACSACRAASRAQRTSLRQAALGAGEPEDPAQRRRIAGPVLGHDLGRRRPHDEPQGERRDDRVVERAGDRHEVRDEVERHREVQRGHAEHDLRPERHPRIADEAGEEPGEVRYQRGELTCERAAAEQHEDDDERRPDEQPHRKDRDGALHRYAERARSARLVGIAPLEVSPSWNSRSAATSARPFFASQRVRTSTISSIPVRYADACVGHEQYRPTSARAFGSVRVPFWAMNVTASSKVISPRRRLVSTMIPAAREILASYW